MESLLCILHEETLIIGLGIFFLVCFCIYKFRLNYSKLKLPPGPRPWPVIGNLHLLGNLPHHSLTALARKHGSILFLRFGSVPTVVAKEFLKTHDLVFANRPRAWPMIGNLHLLRYPPHHSLTTLARKYGSIMFLRLGSVPTVVVSSLEMAKKFLKTHDVVFANRPNSSFGKYICYDHRDVAFGQYGTYWRDMRKLCTVELLTGKRIDSFRFVRAEEVSAMVGSIWKESGQGAVCVNLRKYLSALTRNVTCRMFASGTYSDSELKEGIGFKEMVEEIVVVSGSFCIGDLIPSLDWLDLYGFRRRMQAAHKIFDGFAEKVIEEHVQMRLAGERGDRVKDLVDVMLDMAESGRQKISRLNMKAIIFDILAAGIETSSTTIDWAMSELLRNPVALARARKEIECAVGRDRTVKEGDVIRLEYLRCALKETFRLHPPFPLLIPPKTRLLVKTFGKTLIFSSQRGLWGAIRM